MTNDGSRKERHVEAMLAKLTGFYNGVNSKNADDVHPFHLPAQVIAKLQKDIDDFLAHYTWLANNALDDGKSQWLVVPKFHYMWHVGKEAMHLSPRMSWCYSNEAFVCLFSLCVFVRYQSHHI